MVSEFAGRRDYIVERLNSITGMSCLKPGGAFYVFSNIARLLRRNCEGRIINDSLSLSELLLNGARVAVVPGSAFGSDKHIRLSYATSLEKIVEGLNRIEEWIKKLS